MNAICENSLYGVCPCKRKYHMPLALPLYDGHSHVDLFFKYGLSESKFNQILSNGRKLTLIDNRHQYYRWFNSCVIESSNVKTLETFGIHPKYLPNDAQPVLKQLDNIVKDKRHLGTTVVAIGECGMDSSSTWPFDYQMYLFKYQLKIAAESCLPVVLHARGNNTSETILNELKSHLHHTHQIHWHCVNPKANLNIITNFLNYFENSFIGLNGSMLMLNDNDCQKVFHNWLLSQESVLDRIIIETDFPFLRPSTLETTQYNPISGIATTAQQIVNILRIKNCNATKIIDRSNQNIRKMYNIDSL